jgi:hypothetical protein
MTDFTPAERLHRLVKAALDSGQASSLVEAEARFGGYRLGIVIDAEEAGDAHHQAALLTTVALARRVFLGGVSVTGPLDVATRVPGHPRCLGEAVSALGGACGRPDDAVPTIFIGGGARARRDGFRIRTAHAGWRGGILPAHLEEAPASAPVMPLAPMLAAGLAVNDAFLHVDGEHPMAGRRPMGLSLWRPSDDWLAASDEPELAYLPSRLWLIGLGHLGQAYLWALGLLPYRDPAALSLVLQDVDVVTPSTESTSILTDAGVVGVPKTRAMAAWAERRGFRTAIVERRFDAGFARRDDEPAVALCGMDNALGRRALDRVGFGLVVEAGLGRGHDDFRRMRVHTLPGPRPASELWSDEDGGGPHARHQPAYDRMLRTRPAKTALWCLG